MTDAKPSSKQAMAALKRLIDDATDNSASQGELRELRERVAKLEEAQRQRERVEAKPAAGDSTLKAVAPWIMGLIGLATVLANIVRALLP